MVANPLLELQKLGQSVWYDNIHRGLLKSGGIKKLIDDGEIVGITSNPTILDKAISGSADYDNSVREHLSEHPQCNTECLYEYLVIDDISAAADLLRSVYDNTSGQDGYVSIEVSPRLAYNTESTIEEARRLFSKFNRPNIMIKVPATPAGLPAITTLIGEGININVTLIFGLNNYIKVAEAYIAGMEKLADSGRDLGKVASVASFFVSRIDTAVDKELPDGSPLRGRAAIANAELAYARSREIFSSERFGKLRSQGARIQRVLWASTSTKNPEYSDVLYVDGLIATETVNTIPPKTINAYRNHGSPGIRLIGDPTEAIRLFQQLEESGIDIDAVTHKLQEDGVASFSASFDSLLNSLAAKIAKVGSR